MVKKINSLRFQESHWKGVLGDEGDLETHHGFEMMAIREVKKLEKVPDECKESDTVYITIVNHNPEGERKIVVKNKAHIVNNTSVIVTATGGIVSAKRFKLVPAAWIDEAGKNHESDPCEECRSVSSVCTVCLVESKMGLIQKSIGVVQGCRVAETLVKTIEKMSKQKVTKKEAEAAQMMKDIEELAKHYWVLESKTKRSVRDVSAYGTSLKEAAEDFVKDGVHKDFLEEMRDMTEVKKSIEEANEQHNIIKGEVALIKEKAKGSAETFKEKFDRTKQYRVELEDPVFLPQFTYLSIPIVGTVMGGAQGAAVAATAAMDEFDNLASKIGVGALAGAGGLVTGIGASIAALPMGPYLWYKAIAMHFDAENFGALQEQFISIVNQMSLIDTHLGNITQALGDIEDHLKAASKAGAKVMTVDGEKRKIMVGRVIKRAEELILACNAYFELTKQRVASIS